ncbi:MAG TPA: putative sugar nucleotidyl transferase [Pirellulales bacterium]|jgi:glucose-1-phosphate thymidylyltransferase|nr:putative sugar nucleotidyl transferase [Pirellulales bacterium]
MQVVVFEDERVPQLYPVTIGRAACMIGCGSFQLTDLLSLLGPLHLLVRPHLAATLQADDWDVGFTGSSAGQPVLLVNARLVPSVAVLETLRGMASAGRAGAVRQGNHLAAALLAFGEHAKPLPSPGHALQATAGLPALPGVAELPMFEYPHDIIRHHLTSLRPNLEYRLRTGSYREVRDGVFIDAEAKLGEYLTVDTSNGPIILEQGASVGPYCFLSGPAHLGRAARVIEQAAIKDGVALGHTTKIGGEVEGSVIEPYTNKQHHGFLGHSYLGSWVNLGAGTCNSDLKNTYGPVNMEYHGQRVPTGMQFVGCIVGDYAKSAINTGIFTGKTIGACSMLYGFVTTNVPSFVNYARLFGQVTELPVEVMVQTQARMFKRRSVDQRPCDVQLLHDMYELTRHERQIAGEPLSL